MSQAVQPSQANDVHGHPMDKWIQHHLSRLEKIMDTHPFTFRWILEWEPGNTFVVQGHSRSTLFFHQHHMVPTLFYPITLKWSHGNLLSIPSIIDDMVYRNTALPIDTDSTSLDTILPLTPVLLMDAQTPNQVISLVYRIILYLSDYSKRLPSLEEVDE